MVDSQIGLIHFNMNNNYNESERTIIKEKTEFVCNSRKTHEHICAICGEYYNPEFPHQNCYKNK